MGSRILGYDFARAFAIFGMVVVNFKIVMGATSGSKWLISAASLLEGRAAAVFVVLAGVGISLMTASARAEFASSLMTKHRVSLLKRSLLLVVVGLSYSPIWPADILHFYGFYIAMAVLLLSVKDQWLIATAIFLNIAFVCLFVVLDYEAGWDWTTLHYSGFWTPTGMVRHIFFNGFHPVIPWASFLLVGMWLGRQDMSNDRLRRQIMLSSLVIWVATEFLSDKAVVYFSETVTGLPPGDIAALAGTGPMPPMPQYILAAGSAAIFFISLCISLTSKFAESRWVDVFCKTGKMSLTFYVAHVVIGMGFLEIIGRLENQTIGFTLLSALLFNVLCMAFASFWMLNHKTGPLEWVFRKLTG